MATTVPANYLYSHSNKKMPDFYLGIVKALEQEGYEYTVRQSSNHVPHIVIHLAENFSVTWFKKLQCFKLFYPYPNLPVGEQITKCRNSDEVITKIKETMNNG